MNALLIFVMSKSYWLICPNWTEVIRFTKNDNNKDRFNEYMFVDTGLVTGIYGDKPPLMKKRVEIRLEEAREMWQKLITAGWQITDPKW